MEQEQQAPAWWEDEGPDICEGCEAAYYAEVGYYCSHCDSGICSACVAFVETGVLLCERCHNEQTKNAGKSGGES